MGFSTIKNNELYLYESTCLRSKTKVWPKIFNIILEENIMQLKNT